MGVLLKQVAAEVRTDELRTQLHKIGSAFLDHREVNAQEAAYRIFNPVNANEATKQVCGIG